MKHVMLALLFTLVAAALAGAPQRLHAAPQDHCSSASLPPKFSCVALGGGLSEPTAMAFEPTSKRIFVTEKGGALRIIRPNGTLAPTPFATFHVSTESERGLLGIAFGPNYAKSGYVYVYYTTGPGAQNYSGTPENRVSRIRKTKTGSISEKVILDHIPSTEGNHNAGDIHFGFDGKLYIAVGDGGCGCNAAQRLNTLSGKILRIHPNGTIPTDNPFYNTAGARREIFAFGFRNPWRFTLRSSNHSYIVADVGQSTWEEIDVLTQGKNYGWPQYEGPCPSSNLGCDPSNVNRHGTIKPIHWYNHSGGGEVGNVIAGGVFAENSNYPAPYSDAYFYGDAGAGWVHTFTLDSTNDPSAVHEFDQLSAPVSFGNGPDGNLYAVDLGAGLIYKYIYTP